MSEPNELQRLWSLEGSKRELESQLEIAQTERDQAMAQVGASRARAEAWEAAFHALLAKKGRK